MQADQSGTTRGGRADAGAGPRPAIPDVDPELQDRLRPLLRFLYERWWRVALRGLRNVPAEGPVLLVGNHSGAIPVDAAMLSHALDREGSPLRRTARVLYDRFVDGMPALASLYQGVGGVTARFDVADALLRRGELVVIFPEGIGGVAKLFEERYQLQRFSSSSARLAWKHRCPVVPFAIVGAEEAYPLVGRSREGGERFGAPYMPLTPWFPALGPLGLLPFPSRWSIAFGPAVHLHRERRFLDGEPDFDAMTERLRRSVQVLLDRGVRERRSVVLG